MNLSKFGNNIRVKCTIKIIPFCVEEHRTKRNSNSHTYT